MPSLKAALISKISNKVNFDPKLIKTDAGEIFIKVNSGQKLIKMQFRTILINHIEKSH